MKWFYDGFVPLYFLHWIPLYPHFLHSMVIFDCFLSREVNYYDLIFSPLFFVQSWALKHLIPSNFYSSKLSPCLPCFCMFNEILRKLPRYLKGWYLVECSKIKITKVFDTKVVTGKCNNFRKYHCCCMKMFMTCFLCLCQNYVCLFYFLWFRGHLFLYKIWTIHTGFIDICHDLS